MTDISDLVKRLRALALPRSDDQRSLSERFFEGYAGRMAEELKEAAATLEAQQEEIRRLTGILAAVMPYVEAAEGMGEGGTAKYEIARHDARVALPETAFARDEIATLARRAWPMPSAP